MKANSRRTLLPAALFVAGLLTGAATCSSFNPAQDRARAEEPAKAKAVTGETASAAALPEGRLSVADVADKVTPSVVSVFSEHHAAPLNGRQMQQFSSDPFFQFFHGPGGPQESPGEAAGAPEQSLGSGVIVSSDGVILTNNHVVDDADKIRVSLKDGRELDATVVGKDEKSDLAVLRVKAKDLPAIQLADSAKLRTGDFVLAVGSPFGLKQTVTMGIVSATGRANMGITDYEDFIQTDAAINPGNSGGALVTLDGRLIGINTAIASRTGGYQGVGFAIPSNMVMQVKDAILREGRVVRGYLGVAIQDVTPELAAAMQLDVKQGVVVSDVSAGSPASKVGLKRGDVIVGLNGTKISDALQLRRLVADAGKAKQVGLDFVRDGKKLSIGVQLGEQPGEATASTQARQSGNVEALGGVALQDLGALTRRQAGVPENVQGVIVTRVLPGSKAAAAGLREGDVIVEVNRTATPNTTALHAALARSKERTLLLIYRDGSTAFMLVPR